MTIVVKFGGDPIAKSPFTVGVAAPLDLSKVSLDNLDGSKKTGGTNTFNNISELKKHNISDETSEKVRKNLVCVWSEPLASFPVSIVHHFLI